MGIVEFNAWVEETIAQTGRSSDPESWAGSENDEFWSQNRQRQG